MRKSLKNIGGCRDLILHRSHTVAAPMHHMESGGKQWDTVKPLHMWFKDVSRVLLVDDDSYKVSHRPQLLLSLATSSSMIDRMIARQQDAVLFNMCMHCALRSEEQMACLSAWAA